MGRNTADPRNVSALQTILGMWILGMFAESIMHVMSTLAMTPKLKALPVGWGRWIWNPLIDMKVGDGSLPFLLDSAGAAVGVILAITLFSDAKNVAPESKKNALLGTVVGLVLAAALLPGATLAQVALLAAGLGCCFGASVGCEFTAHSGLYGTFGAVFGMTLWLFALCGGAVTVVAMIVLVIVNLLGVCVGYILGALGFGIGALIAKAIRGARYR